MDFISFKEDSLLKFSNSEQGRKIIEQLQKLQRNYEKLSGNERKVFAENFEDKLRVATQKLESIRVKEEKFNDNSFLSFDFVLILTVIFIGKKLKIIS